MFDLSHGVVKIRTLYVINDIGIKLRSSHLHMQLLSV
jgi:hypothetical protein